MWSSKVADLNMPSNDKYIDWLTKPEVLSHALRNVCKNLTVKVIAQYIGTATVDEQRALHINEQLSFIREIYLCGDDVPWVYARVIAPFATYTQFKQELDTLGTNLLGEHFLLKQKERHRSEFTYARFDKETCARRSTFFVAGCPILITETFLPAIPEFKHQVALPRPSL